MMADTLAELHAMAAELGLRPEWFQSHTRFLHYDLRPSTRQAAIQRGAVEISTMEMVRKFKNQRSVL
jgi:hypothetical protein